MGVFLFVAFNRVRSLGVRYKAVTLYHVQPVCEWRPIHVEHRIRAALDADCIDDQRIVSSIMADGISVPGGSDMRRMLRIQPDEAHLLAMPVDEGDVVLSRQKLEQKVPE